MFQYIYPVFERKNLLKKSMLDELRDYPLNFSRMYFAEYGDGVLAGCGIGWEKEELCIYPGLLRYGGNVYRMEEACRLECTATDELDYLKVRFATTDYERGRRGGIGEIVLDNIPPVHGEMELGRFRLQEGARLRTTYENFEDYRTEYDTVNRIHVPYIQSGGPGLWPQLLKVYAQELMETGTADVYDASFAMTLLGADGRVSPECVRWYIKKAGGVQESGMSNADCYKGLVDILKNRRNGGSGWQRQEGGRRQMILM